MAASGNFKLLKKELKKEKRKLIKTKTAQQER